MHNESYYKKLIGILWLMGVDNFKQYNKFQTLNLKQKELFLNSVIAHHYDFHSFIFLKTHCGVALQDYGAGLEAFLVYRDEDFGRFDYSDVQPIYQILTHEEKKGGGHEMSELEKNDKMLTTDDQFNAVYRKYYDEIKEYRNEHTIKVAFDAVKATEKLLGFQKPIFDCLIDLAKDDKELIHRTSTEDKEESPNSVTMEDFFKQNTERDISTIRPSSKITIIANIFNGMKRLFS